MRIVFLINRLDRSGGSRVIQELSDGLVRRGHEVVWHCRPGEDPSRGFPTLAKLQFPSEAVRRPNRTLWNVLGYFQLLRGVPRCDVVVATFYPTSLLAWLLSRGGSPARRGAYFIQMLEGAFRGGWRPWASDLTYRLPLVRIVNSLWMEHEVARRAPGPLGRIRLGLDPVFRPRSPRPRDSSAPVRIGCVGRSLAVKGLDDFWSLLRLLGDRHRLRGVVITQEDLVPPTDLDVEILHPDGDAALVEAYGNLDLFVSTSRQESFGYPPLEAMAIGVPVALTDSGGVREYARDGENCLLVPHSDPRALATACDRILQDAALRDRLVEAGLATSAAHRWPESVEHFEALLAQAAP